MLFPGHPYCLIISFILKRLELSALLHFFEKSNASFEAFPYLLKIESAASLYRWSSTHIESSSFFKVGWVCAVILFVTNNEKHKSNISE
jgi:hypothetical protein